MGVEVSIHYPKHPGYRMLLSASILLLCCTFATFADGQADSKGCCQKKNVPGSMPMSGNYFLTEHRNGLPNDCKDGCVYMKENSGKVEYCFRPSSTYTAQCQDKVTVTTSGQTCWDTCELVAHQFSQDLIKNIGNNSDLLNEKLCPLYLEDPTKCADLLPTIWTNFASTFWSAFYDRSLADLNGTQNQPTGWTNLMYHCGELHCGSPRGVPLPCENCTRSIEASIALLIYPTTLDAISTTYLEAGFCNAIGEGCPEILELIVTTGLPLLADQSIAANAEQVCDAARPGTCTGYSEELYVEDLFYKSCWGDCTSLVDAFVAHLISEKSITDQQDILVGRLCSESNLVECGEKLPDIWQSLASTFWPNFYKKAGNETEYGSPSGRTISLFNCAEFHCGEDSFTCDTCTSSIKASIDFLMSFASDEIVMGGLLETLGWVCESSQQREFCTELLSLLLTDGIQHLAAEVLPDDYVEVCNAATSGTCN